MTDNYIQSMLGENEEVLLVTRQHWFVLFSSILLEIIVIVVVIVGASIISFNIPPFGALAFLLVLLPLASMVHDILYWKSRQYIVTNRRVIQFAGIINKSVVDSSLEKVNDVKLTQPFLGRIFDYGDVEIMTASELGVNLFKFIGNPVDFKTTMINAKEKLGYEGGVSSAPRGDSIPVMIGKLDELRQKGILTEEEFQAKKKELLAKM